MTSLNPRPPSTETNPGVLLSSLQPTPKAPTPSKPSKAGRMVAFVFGSVANLENSKCDAAAFVRSMKC